MEHLEHALPPPFLAAGLCLPESAASATTCPAHCLPTNAASSTIERSRSAFRHSLIASHLPADRNRDGFDRRSDGHRNNDDSHRNGDDSYRHGRKRRRSESPNRNGDSSRNPSSRNAPAPHHHQSQVPKVLTCKLASFPGTCQRCVARFELPANCACILSCCDGLSMIGHMQSYTHLSVMIRVLLGPGQAGAVRSVPRQGQQHHGHRLLCGVAGLQSAHRGPGAPVQHGQAEVYDQA